MSRTQPSDAMTSRLPRYEAKCVQRSRYAGASKAGRSLCVQISRERSYPLPICWYHSKGNWLHYNPAAQSFYIMKLCSRLFVNRLRKDAESDLFSTSEKKHGQLYTYIRILSNLRELPEKYRFDEWRHFRRTSTASREISWSQFLSDWCGTFPNVAHNNSCRARQTK